MEADLSDKPAWVQATAMASGTTHRTTAPPS